MDRVRQADIVIAELTGHNAEVMFEFGVATGIKDKQRVILIREQTDEPGAFHFDVMLARHIVYSRTLAGLLQLSARLQEAIALLPACSPL